MSESGFMCVIGLLTPERLFLYYKYFKLNPPERKGEHFCSAELFQLSVAQPTLLIKCQKPFVSAPLQGLHRSTTRPKGSVRRHSATEDLSRAMDHIDHVTVGHCFYPADICLFISPQHQGLLVTQIKGQLRH